MAAISSNGTTGNWTTSNTAIWTGGVVPTAADDVTITSGSNLTIPASNTVPCRSLTVNSGATLNHSNATTVINIGDGTAGAGNVALSFNSGCTYTTSSTNGVINFISTSATQQTVDFGGKTTTNVTFNGAGSSYILASAIAGSASALTNFTISAGTFDTGNYNISTGAFNYGNASTRTITLGSSVITLSSSSTAFNGTAVTNLTVTANTARCDISNSSGSISLSTKDWNGLSFKFTSTADGTRTITTTGATVGTLETSSATGQVTILSLTGNITCSSLVATGPDAINRPIIQSNTVGTARTITAASTTLTNCDFMDITGAGAGSWTVTSGVIGDRLGNSGITFTTPATQTRDSTSGQAWGISARWTSRVPLPQDDVVLNASSGSISSTDVLCLGKSIDMTGYTGTITQTTNSTRYTIFGSVNLGGVTWGSSPTVNSVGFCGRGSHTITSNGKTFFPSASNSSHEILAPGGTYTLADAFTQSVPINVGSSFAVKAGSFVTNNYSMTVGRFFANGSLTRSVTLGSSNITLLNDSGSQVILLTTDGLTWSGASSSWTLSTASANTSNRSLDLVGFTIGSFTYNVANSPAGLTITSSAVINTFTIGTGRRLVIGNSQVLTSTNYTLTGTANGYVYMPGDAYGASAPDSAALSIAGDMDFRQRMSFDSLTPAGSMRIAGKYNTTGNQKTWRWYITNTGALTLDMSTTGADSSTASTSTTLVALGLSANTNYWMRFTREKSTGNVKFYYAADNASMPSSWTQIGTTQTATTSSLFDSTALLTIGSEQTGINSNPGRYYRSQLRNNILDDGTGIQFDAVFSAKTVGADTFTESSSNAATVTMNGLSVYGDGRLQIVSNSAGNKAYISKPSGGPLTGTDYLKVQDIAFYEALNFYTGANTIQVSNVSGLYTAATAYTHNQSAATYTASSSTSQSSTFPVATTSGKLLVAYVESGGSTGAVTGISGWTQAVASTNGGSAFIYYKIADGTETTVTYSQETSRVITMSVVEYNGFSGTPTLDVTDNNNSGTTVTSLSTTAGTGPTNTAQPALALAFAAGTSNLAAWVSATNSFIPDFTTGGQGSGNYMHVVVKELTALAANDTTITWTTSRANVYTGLAVFKNVSSFSPKIVMIM